MLTQILMFALGLVCLVAGAEALLTDDQCLYPSTEHVCSGDPVTEVAQAWQEQMALADDDLDFYIKGES